jgi:nicotinamidase-related amidase
MIPATTVACRDKALLVVVDIQERLAAAMAFREHMMARTLLMIRTAGIVQVPILVTRQYPKGLGALEDAISEALAEVEPATTVTTVDKLSFDCFSEPVFCDAVAAHGRSQILLAGMETHICVVQTALAGLREGFDVHVAEDACCSRDEANHRSALARLGHAGAVITTAESAAYEWIGCAGTDEFKSLLAVVKG